MNDQKCSKEINRVHISQKNNKIKEAQKSENRLIEN